LTLREEGKACFPDEERKMKRGSERAWRTKKRSTERELKNEGKRNTTKRREEKKLSNDAQAGKKTNGYGGGASEL